LPVSGFSLSLIRITRGTQNERAAQAADRGQEGETGTDAGGSKEQDQTANLRCQSPFSAVFQVGEFRSQAADTPPNRENEREDLNQILNGILGPSSGDGSPYRSGSPSLGQFASSGRVSQASNVPPERASPRPHAVSSSGTDPVIERYDARF
jgi:hypothetical protein